MKIRAAKYLTALTACLTAVSAGVGHAQEMTLRVADTFPIANNHLTEGLIPWMEEVTRLTDGRLAFQHFPAGQLGSSTDMLTLAQTGAVDIAYVAPAYLSDKLPLGEVGTMPGMFSTSCEGSRAFRKVVSQDGPLKQEFTDNGVHVILAVTNPPYQIYTVSHSIASTSDVKGLRLRSGGGLQDMIVSTIGGVPIRMAAPDTRESLSRGTLDGVIFVANSLGAYGLDELVQYGSGSAASFGSFVVTFGVNLDVWNKLPEEFKTAMETAADTVTERWCAALQAGNDEAIDSLRARGAQIKDFSPEEIEALRGYAKTVAKQWVSDLEARGKPAEQVFEAFSAALGQ
jgi:TRAP-type C4-dicarboxylate transport system substrate-binding protein